mgnify:FL=1
MSLHEIQPDTFYRVVIRHDTKTVDVTQIGINCVDSDYSGRYDSVDVLPELMQSRLSRLLLCDPTPPNEWIAGVGKRIDDHIFWVDGMPP